MNREWTRLGQATARQATNELEENSETRFNRRWTQIYADKDWGIDRLRNVRFETATERGLVSADYTDYADFGLGLVHVPLHKNSFLARSRFP